MTAHVDELLARRTELSATEEARVRQHLDQCPACRETAAAYASQTVLLRAMPMADPPPALRAGVLARVHQPAPVPWWRRWPPALLLGPAGALVAAAVITLAVLGHSGKRSSSAMAPRSSHTPVPTQQALPRSTPLTGGGGFHPIPRRHGPKAHVHRPIPTAASGPGLSGTSGAPSVAQQIVPTFTPAPSGPAFVPAPTVAASPTAKRPVPASHGGKQHTGPVGSGAASPPTPVVQPTAVVAAASPRPHPTGAPAAPTAAAQPTFVAPVKATPAPTVAVAAASTAVAAAPPTVLLPTATPVPTPPPPQIPSPVSGLPVPSPTPSPGP
jgi:hypothetical protein